MRIIENGTDTIVENCGLFDLAMSVDCGQAFRWQVEESSTCTAIAGSKYIKVTQDGDRLIFHSTTPDEFNSIWRKYFDLDRDYAEVCRRLSVDEGLKTACEKCGGIHILKQEPWETLCSFIISQNNNIPRIKGIISRLCEQFGQPIQGGFSFPDALTLSKLTPEDLAPIRAGFRAKYIIDAAKKVSSGEVDFERIEAEPIEFGRTELIKICGVGAKVAECVLLYGFHKLEAFPVDVWVKRIMSEMYPNGFPACADSVQGIAQQYLFHWRRNFA